MSVLHFGFDDENEDNPHRPQNLCKSNVVYTGTHDNDTTMGWWSDANEDGKSELKKLDWPVKIPVKRSFAWPCHLPHPWQWFHCRISLELGTDARMNTPGKPDGNWRWKFDWPQLAQGKWSIMQRSEF